jgi:LmbE family N-acetylglucosaminyl deacetylase
VAAALGSAVDRLRPSLIYAPSTVDFHPEHRGVALALARALGQCDAGALPPRLRVYPVQVPLTRILVNRLAATGDVAATSRAALETYATQVGALRSSLRMKRYAALRYRAGTQAEVFWELPADDYRDMVLASADPVCPPSRPLYRGVRRLPFSDPLAYLRGRRARRRLGAIAARE